jgi:hypothetical protein
MNSRFQLGIILFLLSGFESCTYYLGPNRLVRQFKDTPSTAPDVYDYTGSYSDKADYDIHDSIFEFYNEMPVPQKQTITGRDLVRIILARLVQKRDIQQVNDFIIRLKPWAAHGSTGPFHKKGDYDFTEISWCALLYLFGDKPDLLFPETRKHLVDVLIENSGPKPELRMPGTARLFRETENHILMGEVSRYLKNQWLHEHGNQSPAFDNEKNGIEKWMLNHLDEKFRGGFYEFNSNPYSGYTFQALNTLFSFTHSDTVRRAANKILNEIIYEYSLGSINQNRYPVFRRQMKRGSGQAFDWDPVSSIVHVLISLKTGVPYTVREKQHGLITLLLHYRMNDALLCRVLEKKTNYFARLGHGRKGSPEIYTGGENYVISSGGVQRGKISQLAPRPIILLLNDSVVNAGSCFRLYGKGKTPKWNNTGVYYNFACNNRAVSVPPQFNPLFEKDGWKLFYSVQSHLVIITYVAKGVGILTVNSHSTAPDSSYLYKLIQSNKGLNLKKQFRMPGIGIISYRLNSPKNKWVIYKINNQKLQRKFDAWKRLDVVQMRNDPWN